MQRLHNHETTPNRRAPVKLCFDLSGLSTVQEKDLGISRLGREFPKLAGKTRQVQLSGIFHKKRGPLTGGRAWKTLQQGIYSDTL